MVGLFTQFERICGRLIGFFGSLALSVGLLLSASGHSSAQTQTGVQHRPHVYSIGSHSTRKRSYVRRRGIRQAGPRQLNRGRLNYQSVPRRRDASRAAAPRFARRFFHPRFKGYFSHRLPHLREGYYRHDLWPDFYEHKNGYAQPYTPYFSHYFTPFQKGRYSRHFKY